ncbi:putative ErfK/YbiS/YcfS/YnhG family protein [Sulfurovum sp. enrichment culture clone C5]|uniref:Putative ErfK/YbiS/YcfS/YnhG family protein n=1 Tax=Sulfurovum sp. enrichment culture clone C5 TaxID=497650 RepID=A0A0S4XN79_9BACT|nr:putative ErfK/YbiS/YcfS/YnhG family protein [Sulfurovum sp. enrichment culture clone C5]
MIHFRLTSIIKALAITLLISTFGFSGEYHEDGGALINSTVKTQDKTSFLRKFYEQLYFVPVWTQENDISNFTKQLLKQIDSDKTLEATSSIRLNAFGVLSKANTQYKSMTLDQKIAFEFEIANLYKNYIDHLLNGNINWSAFKGMLVNPRDENEINGGWVTYPSKFNLYNIMQDALVNGSLADTLYRASPKGFNYEAMNNELIKYLEIKQKGGWKIISAKGVIKPGQTSKFVPLIRERLGATGELGGCGNSDSTLYDACLQKAIMKFQKNNGIHPSGTIDDRTFKALGESVDKRISKIRLNMDRMKWLNHRFEPRSIMINIPDFKLTFIENGKVKKEMKVITGSKNHRTPIFSNRVSNIVLNPYWNVPQSIIQKEMIPKLLRNPGAMGGQGIEVYQGGSKINPASVNWNQYRGGNVPFRFAQPPGMRNALGKIKFLFPNNFAVYMHDTPTKNLFNKDVRAFSHGCIRLGEPMELFKIFASFDSAINLAHANKVLKGNSETNIALKNSIPVDIVYLTCWMNQDGELQFREDVYGYDAMQSRK